MDNKKLTLRIHGLMKKLQLTKSELLCFAEVRAKPDFWILLPAYTVECLTNRFHSLYYWAEVHNFMSSENQKQ